jgi:hypothetical protein
MKYIYIILYNELNTIKTLSQVFFKTIITNHEMLKEIILNRDKLFTLKF